MGWYRFVVVRHILTLPHLTLNDPHKPHQNAIDAFKHVLHEIKHAIRESRRTYAEPMMWSRAAGLSDHQLVDFEIEKDLVLVRAAVVSYGTIILGKIRIPAVNDELGEGYVHVRIHDPGEKEVTFHSILTLEDNRDADGHPHLWRAVQPDDYPLEFFNE
ncbi:hypothetical protein HYDPIDRAFT_173679 [Hydnomerulius pinastri MD-312]|nr:hypothetical protein HYDPIDRAFT_173679 [Hydnomerulius pinastri MD-312]